MKTKFAIIGGGSWATALLKIISSHTEVNCIWWLRSETDVEYVNKYKHNPKYLSSVEIDTNIVEVTHNLQYALDEAEYIVLAIPSAFLSQSLEFAQLPKNKIYISAIKGIDPASREVIARLLIKKYGIAETNIALITGPCHAEEVALEKLSYLTISALDEELAKTIEKNVQCRYINTTVNTDLYGAEVAAVLKNIYAIGAGIAHGLGYGDNFLAVYVGACLREIEYFLDQLHESHRDVKNAAYLGDLLVTCYSQFSRNRTFGNMLGKGYSVKSAQLEMNMIAEGYYAIESIEKMRFDLGISMPIAESIYAVVYKNGIARKVFGELCLKID